MSCILFEGFVNSGGYGMQQHRGRSVTSHRLAYAKSRGIELDDIKGMVVMHECDTPRCINPDHLRLGTQKQNIDDKVEKNRQAKGSKHGIAKLCEGTAALIRSEYRKGVRGKGCYSLAKKYGVNQSTVFRLVSGETWRHVEKHTGGE